MPSPRLIFVSGKGGTGKSAFAAALAIDHARRGRRVLAIDMAGRLGLAAHLRARGLTYQPTEIRPGLHALTMVRSEALDEYLKLQLHVPMGAPTRQLSSALSVLADTAPGVREIISIGKPIHEIWSGRWDVVIVDAVPLGQFQAYLRAPTTITDLVPSGNVRRQSGQLASALSDPEITSTVLVSIPTELAMLETKEAAEAFDEDPACLKPSVVVNRVLSPSGISAEDLLRIPAGPTHGAAALQIGLEAQQAAWIDTVEHTDELPYLFGVLTPGEVALQLADCIGGSP